MPPTAVDYTGKRFGRLLVLERAGSLHHGPLWRCRCDCGREKLVPSSYLRNGHTRSCGCIRGEKLSGRLQDHTGKRFGRLLVLRRAPNKCGNTAWFCRCDCGNERAIDAYALLSGHSVSCGCYRRDRTSLPPGEAAFNRLYGSYRRASGKRGLAFALSPEQFRELSLLNCWYCGSPPTAHAYRLRTGPWVGNGIDRIDNALGYITGNVRPCCRVCNRAKRELSEGDFLAWLRQVARHWPPKNA